jgi:hypothetical protein
MTIVQNMFKNMWKLCGNHVDFSAGSIMTVVFEELFHAEPFPFGRGEMLLAEKSQQAVLALIERNVFDLVPENCCKLIFAIEKSQDAATDEDLTARERNGAPESGIPFHGGIES